MVNFAEFPEEEIFVFWKKLDSDMHITRSNSQAITSDAEIFALELHTAIIYPLTDEEYYLNDEQERMRFAVPTHTVFAGISLRVHVHVQFASDPYFNDVFWDYYSWQYPDRFSYFDGNEFVPWPLEGVHPDYYGNEGNFKVQGPEPEQLIQRGRWYWRIRGVLGGQP